MPICMSTHAPTRMPTLPRLVDTAMQSAGGAPVGVLVNNVGISYDYPDELLEISDEVQLCLSLPHECEAFACLLNYLVGRRGDG